MIPHLTHDALALPGIAHGFFTREGGVSGGIYASLNCGLGSRDERDHVLANRTSVAATLGVAAGNLATPHQVHGTAAVAVDSVWHPGQGPQADALVTRRPGIAIGVGAADCGPVLFADAEARVIGAAHAGWRGALAGILEATVAAMETLGASRRNTVAVLGPSISQRNYEVGPELVERFVAAEAGNARYFVPSTRAGHAMFDLPAYTVDRLARGGVRAANLDLCTYADPARFFSYRRATHLGEPDYGRLLSAIVLSE